jgi:hypothetical protein
MKKMNLYAQALVLRTRRLAIRNLCVIVTCRSVFRPLSFGQDC